MRQNGAGRTTKQRNLNYGEGRVVRHLRPKIAPSKTVPVDCRAAASLVARGLLRQSQDPDDGRGRLLRLTRKGATTYASIKPMAREIETALSAGLSRTEWNALLKALAKLVDHAQPLISGGSDQIAG